MHLILGVEPVYSTWQSFKQALLVDNLLLSYIDVRHTNFLLPKLTIGEAREFGKCYTCSDELAPLRDESAECVSWRLRELAHEAIQEEVLVQGPAHPEDPVEPEAPVEEAEHFAIDVTNLSATDSILGEDMVTRKTMIIDRFVPSARQAIQPYPLRAKPRHLPLLKLAEPGKGRRPPISRPGV